MSWKRKVGEGCMVVRLRSKDAICCSIWIDGIREIFH